MSIRQKAILIITVTLIVFIAALYTAAAAIMNQHTFAIEQLDMKNNVLRAKEAFLFELSRLHAFAWDYATWDDTYNYLAAPNEAYVQNNLGDNTFENGAINFMILADSRGTIRFSKGFDTAKAKTAPIPASLLEHVQTGRLFCASTEAAFKGVLALNDCAMLIAARPVLKSSGSGVPQGTLIIGRFIDRSLIARLNKLMHLTFSIHPVASAEKLPGFVAVTPLLQAEGDIAVKSWTAELINGYTLLNDVYGKPALYIKVELPRPILQRGSVGRMYMAGTCISICFIFGLIIYLGFHKLLNSQAALKESELRFRSIAESTPDAVIHTDNTGSIIFWNRGAEKMFGYTKEEVLGSPSFMLLAEKLREREKANLAEYQKKGAMAATGRIFEMACMRKDGTEFPAEATFSVWNETGKAFFSTMLRDVTERKKSEEERSLLTTAVEQSDELIVITDNNALIRYVNPSFERATGYARSEVLGKKPSLLKSGKQTDAFYRELWQTITKGQVWKGCFVNKRKNGALYNEEAVITPLRDSEGCIRHYVAVKRDVTQKQQLEQQVRQSQKMEAIGTLAGGIAHDFNNILTAIIGFSELSVSRVEKNSQLASNLSNIVDAGFRAKALVDQILTFSRHTEQEMKPMSLSPLVKETVKFLRASLPSTIEIQHTLTVSNDIILGDPTQVHQVLMNLCTNAAHAMKSRGGLLTISLSQELLQEADILAYPGLVPGHYARLSVSDTGHGIPPDIIDHIFEPYFTTKKTGEGTGLGLAVAHGIVKSCNGAISVKSEPGSGATFDVYLPILKTAAASQENTAETAPEGCESILLIDDEEWVCDAAGKILVHLGYRITTQTVPEKALELFRSAPESFDMIVTDKTMPHMTGFDLAAQIRIVRQDIPIILCSGFIERNDKELAENIGIRGIIKKPFTRSQIASAIRRAFEKQQK
jgi:PAS domain S-box-containing protein